jgi:putative phosphoesterase
MKIAILSDLHANLPALEATLEDVDAQAPDLVLCLGDLVGYAPWPDAVVAEVRRRHIPTLAGNYDQGVGASSGDCGCAYRSAEERELGNRSIAYTNRVVSPATRAYLRGLPRHLMLDLGDDRQPFRLLLVHGSPRKINEYLFEDRPDRSLLRLVEEAGADALVFGHTHQPYWRVLESNGESGTLHRHAINAGSVGKPKDGDPRACWALLEVGDGPDPRDPEALRVTFRRVAYDVERAARAIEQCELPDRFAEALRTAR